MPSKDLLEKHEYLTGEDLGHTPSVLEKTKFEYSSLGMSFSKSFKKDNVKHIAKSESDFNYYDKYKLYRFYKQYDEFEEMSLDSNHSKMKKFKRLLNNFKNLKLKKQETQLKKERIMKKVDELHEKYYNDYKNDFDNDDELSESETKNSTTNSFNCLIKQTKS